MRKTTHIRIFLTTKDLMDKELGAISGDRQRLLAAMVELWSNAGQATKRKAILNSHKKLVDSGSL